MANPAINGSTRSVEGTFYWLILGIVLSSICLLLVCPIANLWWSETKGPYRGITDVADLDGDGDLDVILGNTRWESESNSWSGITLWFNHGGGRFTPDDQELPGGSSGAAGDIDLDGDADLLLLGGYNLTALVNQGGAQGGKNGIFKVKDSPISLPVGPGHSDDGGSLLSGELNKDRRVDGFAVGCCYLQSEPDPSNLNASITLVMVNERDDKKGWLKFRKTRLAELDGIPVRGAALGDLDGDGDLDAYAAVGTLKRGGSRSLADMVLLNNGTGNFTDSGQRLGDSGSSSVALGDLDGDGDLDALVGTFNGAVAWINQGGRQGGRAAKFVASGQKIAGNLIRLVFLADLDGDGDQDALLGGKKQASVWWNKGWGTFTRSDERFRYSERHGLAVADFNDDEAPDIFAGAYTDDYRVWLNQGDGTFRAENQP
jgi:hypothetical protein